VRARDDLFEDVVLSAVVGRLERLHYGVLVILRMRSSVVAAKEVVVEVLYTVVGKGMAGQLSTGDSIAIGKGSYEECIDAGLLLQDVQDLLRAFIHKRNRADLDADGGHVLFG
jgi:hypothetical protein